MEGDDPHGGLADDVRALRNSVLERRQMLRWAAGATILPLLGCGTDGAASGGQGTGGSWGSGGRPGSGGFFGSGGAGTGGSGSGGAGTGGSGSGGAGTGDVGTAGAGTGGAGGAGVDACATIPAETAGPYPGDGSNGPNVLTQMGVVRGDIRSSLGGFSTPTAGVPLVLNLSLVNAKGGCASLSGYAIYVWHCDAGGLYSMYSPGVTNENYLRGVQATGDDGRVSFSSIFPGCYAGRWPHIHFEIYPSLMAAASSTGKLSVSQLALPQASCDAVYATSSYQKSVANFRTISLAKDSVFSDGWSLQMASVSGDTLTGYVASLTIGV